MRVTDRLRCANENLQPLPQWPSFTVIAVGVLHKTNVFDTAWD
jgi:hypothetical protein